MSAAAAPSILGVKTIPKIVSLIQSIHEPDEVASLFFGSVLSMDRADAFYSSFRSSHAISAN
jgi:hypothetical protein